MASCEISVLDRSSRFLAEGAKIWSKTRMVFRYFRLIKSTRCEKDVEKLIAGLGLLKLFDSIGPIKSSMKGLAFSASMHEFYEERTRCRESLLCAFSTRISFAKTPFLANLSIRIKSLTQFIFSFFRSLYILTDVLDLLKNKNFSTEEYLVRFLPSIRLYATHWKEFLKKEEHHLLRLSLALGAGDEALASTAAAQRLLEGIAFLPKKEKAPSLLQFFSTAATSLAHTLGFV